MELFGSRGSSSDRASCRLKDQGLKRPKGPTLLLVCLNPAHRLKIETETKSGLMVTSCPLQVNNYLDHHPRQQVILDRCPAALSCCRRPLSELQKRIHAESQEPRVSLRSTSGPNLLHPAPAGRLSSEQLQEALRRLEGHSPERV